MNRKEYLISIAVISTVLIALLISNYFLMYITNWWWVFLIALLSYMYLRYRMSAPMQTFSNKFNMLVDYDLEVQQAKELAQKGVDNAPTQGIKALYMVYLGMAKYYTGEYRDAINTLNQIAIRRLNPAYIVLINAFSAYAAYEEGDVEAFDIAFEKMRSASQRVSRKYVSFAAGYMEILEVIKNLNEDPEKYREVIEKHFSRDDGYITTKLIYNYRMAYYYKAINNTEEMDKCFARVIANGKEHHTALQARKMFTGTCNIEDFVFAAPAEKPIDEPLLEEVDKGEQIDDMDEIEVINEIEDIQEKEADESDAEKKTEQPNEDSTEKDIKK